MEEKLTYKSAMEEIESLVKLLEENKLDVDELSMKKNSQPDFITR